jgi:hypothetical protein
LLQQQRSEQAERGVRLRDVAGEVHVGEYIGFCACAQPLAPRQNCLSRMMCFFFQCGNNQAVQTYAAPCRFECNLPV